LRFPSRGFPQKNVQRVLKAEKITDFPELIFREHGMAGEQWNILLFHHFYSFAHAPLGHRRIFPVDERFAFPPYAALVLQAGEDCVIKKKP
jgi:hypothetical protein